jgi:hypothetical protein
MLINIDIYCYMAMRNMIELKSEEIENLQNSDTLSFRDNIFHTLFIYESIILRHECHF